MTYAQVDTKTLLTLMMYSMRHAMGKQPHLVLDVVDIILKHISSINTNDREYIKDYVSQAIKDDRAGTNNSINQWQKLLNSI